MSFWALEDGTGVWLLEDGTGNWLLEADEEIDVEIKITAMVNKTTLSTRVLEES